MKLPKNYAHKLTPLLASILIVAGCSSNVPKKELIKETDSKPVKVSVVQKTTFIQKLEVVGETKPAESVTVRALVSGKVEFLEDTLGKKIKKNNQLATISRDLYVAQYMASKANNLLNQNNYDRQLDLFKNGFSTTQNIEMSNYQSQQANAQLRQARFQLENADVRAPFDGVISRVFVNKYDVVAPGAQVLEFSDISKLDISVGVTQEHVTLFKPNQVVSVQIPAINAIVMGTITAVSKVADPMSKTYEIVINIDNSNEMIPAGMIAKVVFPVKTHSNVILVHQNLVQTIKDKQYVPIVVDSIQKNTGEDSITFNEQRLVYKEVETGPILGQEVMISSGLEIGDLVVIQGANTLENGQLVNVEYETEQIK